MKAGRELDRIVAEKVMGLKVSRNAGSLAMDLAWHDAEGWHPIGSYSTDIAAAWQVIAKIIDPSKYDYGIRLEYCTESAAGDDYKAQWLCAIHTVTACPAYEDMDSEHIVVRADTAPLAICLAALKAVGVEVPS